MLNLYEMAFSLWLLTSIPRLMILCSLSLISTYVLYRALEIEQLNKFPQLKPNQFAQMVNEQIEKYEYNTEMEPVQQQYKFILFINYKEKDGMSKFSGKIF